MPRPTLYGNSHWQAFGSFSWLWLGLFRLGNQVPDCDTKHFQHAIIGVGSDTTGLLNPIVNTTLGGYASSVTTPNAGAAFVQVGVYGTVKIADNAYAYAGVSGEARTGQTLYGGSVGLRLAF
jgi:hypothetical protein